MIQIIIPAAGRGTRFIGEKHIQPKPMISWDGKTMLDHVVNNLNGPLNKFFIVKRKEHSFNLTENSNVLEIDYTTDGPATTVNLMRDQIEMDRELIVTNCDQIIKDWDQHKFLTFAQDYDAVLGCFISSSNKNSYAKLNEHNCVVEVKEKQVISNIATNGLHYWKKARYFFESYDRMVENNDKTNGEYYVAPSFNYMIDRGLKTGVYMFNFHFPIGTPEDLENYLKHENIKN